MQLRSLQPDHSGIRSLPVHDVPAGRKCEIGDPTVCFDFSELLREQWQAYATRFEQKHAAADIQIPDNITMRGRKEYIQQLTDLLLDNAASIWMITAVFS